MDARVLTRITNVALVAVTGMAAGHLLMPTRAGATGTHRAAFVALVALWMPAGAASALLLAALAWWLMHG